MEFAQGDLFILLLQAGISGVRAGPLEGLREGREEGEGEREREEEEGRGGGRRRNKERKSINKVGTYYFSSV